MIFKIIFLCVIAAVSCQEKIRHLACNSVNQLGQDEEINFIFIGAKSDCTFLFEGPPSTKLDMKVHSLSEGNFISGSPCLSQNRIKVYDYRVDAFVNMGGDCSEQDEGSAITETNMGIVRSLVGNGSFFVRIKTISARTKAFPILGMTPPFENSEDFFRAEDLTHEAESFKPSLGVPGYKPLSTSYGVPAVPDKKPFPYPGKPGQIIDLTTSKPTTAKINETLTTALGSTTTTITISSRPTTDTTTKKTTTRTFSEE